MKIKGAGCITRNLVEVFILAGGVAFVLIPATLLGVLAMLILGQWEWIEEIRISWGDCLVELLRFCD